MKPIDVIIIVAAVLFVVGVATYALWRKKKGKTDCGCGCDCGSCSGCPSAKKDKEE